MATWLETDEADVWGNSEDSNRGEMERHCRKGGGEHGRCPSSQVLNETERVTEMIVGVLQAIVMPRCTL